MQAGFDYGTSHCSIGLVRDRSVELVPLEDGATMIPSTLFAPRPNDQLDSDTIEFTPEILSELRFGKAALDQYLVEPTEGFFVKSPKSFLGASGLSEEVKERFIMVVAAMMANVKQHADVLCGEPIDQVVIGRPINFQAAGIEQTRNAVQANQQALAMLVSAAREAGFEEVRFLYEPLAAAMEYEERLKAERLVLVADIGGGTTDCSFVRVGPERRDDVDRDADLLGYAGERVGGNDYDQLLALASIMPHFGYQKTREDGLPVPNAYFVDAVSTNNVAAQQQFYSARRREYLEDWVRVGVEEVRRLIKVHESRLTYRIGNDAEALKIALTDDCEASFSLDYIENGLSAGGDQAGFADACERLLNHLENLIRTVTRQAGTEPDCFYLTGGMARATIVRRFLKERFPNIEMIDSDHFASVTEGLAIWARRIFAS